jgi:hypothetical protein
LPAVGASLRPPDLQVARSEAGGAVEQHKQGMDQRPAPDPGAGSAGRVHLMHGNQRVGAHALSLPWLAADVIHRPRYMHFGLYHPRPICLPQ